ncbi:MAG: hypothetical protein HKN20_16405, partial [Gemmatimonadetes bacterium]|nr:hypothetical protein [Gemmatimonadota bacterium]
MFAIVLALLLVIGFLLRVLFLSADPPAALSWSQGIYTDGAVVLHDARNLALYGDWIVDYCEDLALFPLSNALGALTFKMFGVSRATAGFPNTVFGIGAILLFTLGLARRTSRRDALFWAYLASFNYYLIMFHRIPIAEPAMVFLMAAAFYFYCAPWERAPSLVLAGAFAFAAPLFGKAHAVYFPAVMFAAFLLASSGTERARGVRLFLIGGLGTVALWAATIFRSHGAYIIDHVLHESVEKHSGGAGGAIREFLQNMIAMGSYTNLFDWQPLLVLLAVIGIAMTASRITGAKGTKATGGVRGVDPVTLLMLIWIVTGWAFFAAVKLPAPRYLVAIAFPFLYFALRPVLHLLNGGSIRWAVPRGGGRVVLGVIVFFLLYQPMISWGLPIVRFLRESGWGTGVYEFFIRTNAYRELVVFCLAATAVLFVILALLFRATGFQRIQIDTTPARGKVFAFLLLGLSLFWNFGNYTYWAGFRTHYLRDASRDLAEWIGPGARVMGSFAPTLGIDNEIPVFPYFGGLGEEDIFAKYGITHVVIASQGDHAFIKDNYPDVFTGLQKVVAYPLLSRYTSVMAIHRLPNRTQSGGVIHDYVPTSFENAVATATEGNWTGALDELNAFVRTAPRHADAYYLAGFM